MDDGELKHRVEAAISEVELPPGKVGTEVYDGRVILIGSVDTLVQESQALFAAKKVPGVKEVLSALRVAEIAPEAQAQIDDDALKRYVQAVLLDHGLAIQGEGVVVLQGEVYLRGLVGSPRQKTKAERIALTIEGVRAVHNELGIRTKG